MPLTIGQVIHNRYRVDALLGQGGMGAVYRGWDVSLNIPVALKEMMPDPNADPHTLAQLRQQFKREAQVVASLDHPNLVRVTDYFSWGSSECLVMNFVQGESLAERIKRGGPLPEDHVLTWARQLLDALTYCHAQGIIHRDIKPQNVIIRPDGRAVLVDFGLVKLWDPRDPRTRTAMRGMGTPEYAPPEQYGARPGHTDPRSDVYSLGATLYHTLTGQSPPTATDRMADPEQFVPVRGLNPRISPETAAMVMKALELARSQRWQSAAEMAAALRGKAPVPAGPAEPERQPTQARPAVRPKRVPGWVWALSGVAAVAVLALCVALALGALGGGAATTAPPTTAPTATPIATPLPVPAGATLGDTWTRPADGMVMVYVPAGEFEMGSTGQEVYYALHLCTEYYDDCKQWRFEDEQPRHTVALDGFWIDRTEVTNRQYRQCVEAGTCSRPAKTDSSTRDSYYDNNLYDDYPVTHVIWQQAKAYCEWTGARLPTEAEWEYAARGSDGRMYPWGSSRPDCDKSNYWDKDDGCVGDTTAVGSYPAGASWCGALDLAGNVWEWVVDWYGDYPSVRRVNPIGPPYGDCRVLRGGSWFSASDLVRGANRSGCTPDDLIIYAGFRCAIGFE